MSLETSIKLGIIRSLRPYIPEQCYRKQDPITRNIGPIYSIHIPESFLKGGYAEKVTPQCESKRSNDQVCSACRIGQGISLMIENGLN